MKKKSIWIIVALFVLAGVVYGAYNIYQIMNPESLFEPQQPEEDTNPQPEDDTEEPPEEEHIEEYRFDEKRLNILLLGLDASPERYETMRVFRTDTIILLSIDFENDEVYMISIPRDSYVKIPGRKNREKINTAFVWGGGFNGEGFELTIETVSNFLGGIPIHYYAGVEMNVFREIIDVMGGVVYEVDVPVKIGSRRIEPGLQKLNGQQVLDYVRFRSTPGGDIDRVERQQKMLLAIFKQLKTTKQLLKIGQYYQAVTGKIYTNLNLKQIAGLGVYALNLDFSQIHTYKAPGNFLHIDGISYWGIDQYKKRDMIKEIFGIDIEIDPRDDVSYIKREVEEKQRMLETAKQDANGVINYVQETMSGYTDYVTQDEKAAINQYINKVQHAIEKEDRNDISSSAKELKGYVDKLIQTWEQRKKEAEEKEAAKAQLEKARNDARNAVAWVKSEMNKRKDKISGQNKGILNQLISQLEELIKGEDINAITAKTNELKSKADAVFKEADKPAEPPQKDPQEGENNNNNNNKLPEGNDQQNQQPGEGSSDNGKSSEGAPPVNNE
ncbi:MAG: hypothetical protein GX024_11370 [Clostridiales bacterium]|mgnify:CR=1 FL=1|nr:hypothetical protein [Clostridiales bacterium]